MNEQEIKQKILEFGSRALEDLFNVDIETLTPKRADNYLSFLSAYSAQLELEYGKLNMVEPIKWVEIRRDTKTNEEAERAWLASPEGQRQMELKHLLKATDKIISACKKRLDRFQRESFNSY